MTTGLEVNIRKYTDWGEGGSRWYWMEVGQFQDPATLHQSDTTRYPFKWKQVRSENLSMICKKFITGIEPRFLGRPVRSLVTVTITLPWLLELL
jgi:hypothetical protein